MARKSYVLTYDRPGYDLIATQNSYSYRLRAPLMIKEDRLVLADGSVMAPGDKFAAIGSDNTSAAFSSIVLKEGYLTFIGLLRDSLDGEEHCLFSYSSFPDLLLYFGGLVIDKDPLNLFFSTPGVAGRRIETTKIVRVPID